ncbi:MAG: AAA family ATPase [Proteobacteria bacterium]|nr:AAA family ATPase [Pseudomonadota bacterium]
MFRTNQPVIDENFFDRERQIQALEDLVHRLAAGSPSWLAIIGPRKVGKTSMVLELARRVRDANVVFVLLDVQSELPLSVEVFRTYVLRILDGILGPDLPVSLEVVAATPAEYRDALEESDRYDSLPRDLRSLIRTLPERKADRSFVRACLELPEQLANWFGTHILVAIDEFQELAGLAHKPRGSDPLPVMRSIWQKHQRVAYVVSGSGRTMLEDMVSDEHSPFFQHFSLMYVDRFSLDTGVELLVRASPRDRPIRRTLAKRAVAAIGTHPFYLQLLGEAIVAQTPPYDDRVLKEALQDLLFSPSGRLSLYFQNQFDRVVGRSSFLASVLGALTSGPLRITDIAAAIGTRTGDAVRYVERLRDTVVRDEDGRYRLEDSTFGLWLRWRTPGGTVLPMSLVGDEAERESATVLARMGFDLVYQSLRSRGAFDLLATRGAHQLGVQVKRRATLPLRFGKTEWNRMLADAERFGWRWVIAVVSPDGDVSFLDPSKARRGKEVRLSAAARIDNLLLWL